MFSECVLAGLPFPSRQSFRVILLLEPLQLMSKFTKHRLNILKLLCLLFLKFLSQHDILRRRF